MKSTTVGIDLAKQVFATCTLDDKGTVIARKELQRDALPGWLCQLPAGTVVAMEACSSAHHWGRFCQAQGLIPRLMAAQFVKPFRKSSAVKHDRNDAEATATAARLGNMRFVPVKSVEQQVRLSGHRAREGYKKDALALSNRIRGLLSEFGVAIPASGAALRRVLADLDQLGLPESLLPLIRQLQAHWIDVGQRLKECDDAIKKRADQDEACRRIQSLIGVGPMTADAVVATIGNARHFHNGRQFAAWLGLTPGQYSSGGTVRLGRITRRGDPYLRTLLIQGARSSVQRAKVTSGDRQLPEQRWIVSLSVRLPFGKVLAAVANKHARQIWAMLAYGVDYDPEAAGKNLVAQHNRCVA